MLWWIWLPILFYYIFFHLWLIYSRQKRWRSIQWVILEIKPPKEIAGSPKPFEYIFTNLYGVIGTVDTLTDIYFRGLIQAYFSMEIVGIGGNIHFLIRIPRPYKNLAESLFYAQYPNIEIHEVEDYVDSVPANMPNAEWDLWGTKIILIKPDVYPIRTYPDFLEISGSAEEIKRFIDPSASLMEILSKLQKGEQIWIQILCRPALSDWQKEGKKMVDKLLGREAKKEMGLIQREAVGWAESAKTVTGQALGTAEFSGETAKEKKEDKFKTLSSGEQEVVKAIERNVSKMGFDTKINYVYIAKRELFSRANIGAILGMFDQFNTLNLNGFHLDKKHTATVAKGLLAKHIKTMRKRNMLLMCRQRSFWEKGFVFNIEELASIFHFPATTVAAPRTPRIEVKRGAPPMGLPI